MSLEKRNYNLVDISPISVLVNKLPLNNSSNKPCPSGKMGWSWMELLKCFHLQRHKHGTSSKRVLHLKSWWDFLRHWLLKTAAMKPSGLAFSHMSAWCVPACQLPSGAAETSENFKWSWDPPPHRLPALILLWWNLDCRIVIKGCQLAGVSITLPLQERSLVAAGESPVSLAEARLW